MKALEVTPTSWILYNEEEVKVGILVKKLAKYTLLKTDGHEEYKNKDELESKFGEISFKERIIKESKDIKISDLPVDEEEVFDIDESGDFPSYKKTVSGKARYVPGYWGIKFSNHYVASFCPKLNTLETYDIIGPYKSKFELQAEIALMNKRLQNEQ